MQSACQSGSSHGGGRAKPPIEIFSPPLEKCFGHRLKLLDIVKKFGPILENSSPSWCPKLVTGLLPIELESCSNPIKYGKSCSFDFKKIGKFRS